MAKKVCLASIFFTFLLVTLGGIVHNTGSSLACPDWPLCYGQFFPKMEGGVLIEHGHRLLASFVSFLAVLLVVASWKVKSNRFPLKSWALLALFLVLLQAIFGGVTVLYKLPTVVSTSHLSLAMFYFCLLVFIFHNLQKTNLLGEKTTQVTWSPNLRALAGLLTGFIYLQLILGAFVRHTGSGSACGFGHASMFQCFDLEGWKYTWWPLSHASQAHMFHRIMAALIALLGIFFTFSLFKSVKKGSLRLWAGLFLVAIMTQISLGLLIVAKQLAVVPTTAHLSVAALCLAFIWKLYLEMRTSEVVVFGEVRHSLLGDFLMLTKPKLSGLVIVTSFVGLYLAPGQVSFTQGAYGIFLIALVVTGAAALNSYIERDIDAKMERTKTRPLPDGRLPASFALIFGSALIVTSITGRLNERDKQDIEALEKGRSLIQSLESWLIRMPFSQSEDFNFWQAYAESVSKMLDNELHLIDQQTYIDSKIKEAQLENLKNSRENFSTLIDATQYNQQREKGKKRFSHQAILNALFIFLYRDEPILHMPFKVLTLLMDIDEQFTTWRYRHALLAQRMLGTKVGTGGSSGHQYLKMTADKNRCFTDFFDLSTFLVPRSSLPQLPKEIKKKLNF